MLFEIWVNFLVFFLAVSLAPGVNVENGLYGYLVSGGLYIAFLMFLPKIIEFLKINVNFWSFFIIGSIFSVMFFYALKYLLVGFLSFETFPATQAIFGVSSLRGFELSQSQVILFVAVFSMFLASFNQWLLER